MKIPKKITPDRIKNAIVEIRYTSSIPFEVCVGFFYKALDDTFMYTNRPSPLPFAETKSDINELGLQFEIGQHLFFTEKIKIQLQPNIIIFNCLNSYISWINYLPEIEKVLSQLSTSGAIDTYHRIGIRYISEYPNIDLQSCIKFSFAFGMPEVKSKTYSFKSEFEYKSNRVILNIHNKLPVLNRGLTKSNSEIKQISQIDIDVIKSNISIKMNEIKELLNLIDDIHSCEKEIFFNLLEPEFLATLNPEY